MCSARETCEESEEAESTSSVRQNAADTSEESNLIPVGLSLSFLIPLFFPLHCSGLWMIVREFKEQVRKDFPDKVQS